MAQYPIAQSVIGGDSLGESSNRLKLKRDFNLKSSVINLFTWRRFIGSRWGLKGEYTMNIWKVLSLMLMLSFATPTLANPEPPKTPNVPEKPGEFRQGKAKHHKFKKRMQGDHDQKFLGKHKAVWRMLDLEKGQRNKLFEIGQTFRRDAFSADMSLEDAQHKMRGIWGEETLDDAKINGLVDELTNAHRKKIEAKVSFVKAMRKVLKPDQLKAMHENMRQMHSNKKFRKGKKGRKGKKRNR